MRDLTLITCTADQPIGLALCERFMQRQTMRDFDWVVVDDGDEPARCSMNQRHVRRVREAACSPAQSLCRNLYLALAATDSDRYAIIEHDDYYGPQHLAEMMSGLSGVDACGEGSRWYYNIARRCYRRVQDGAPALCQMAFTRAAKPHLMAVVRSMERADWWGIDLAFWQGLPTARRRTLDSGSVVGIKGLPGRPGIGYGHRPSKDWARDPDGTKLREIVGDDADLYLSLLQPTVLA